VTAFLAAHPDFALLPAPGVWAATLGTPCPVETGMIHLSPGAHETDGFFVAILERAADAKPDDPEPPDPLDPLVPPSADD
jgi:16S rRNA (cytosine967-C5)-methyltransferase